MYGYTRTTDFSGSLAHPFLFAETRGVGARLEVRRVARVRVHRQRFHEMHGVARDRRYLIFAVIDGTEVDRQPVSSRAECPKDFSLA